MSARPGKPFALAAKRRFAPGLPRASTPAGRRAGDHVLLLPAFERLEAGDSASFGPPAYFTRGLPVLRAEQLASAPDLLPLTRRELALAIQWTAPASVLGRYPEPAALRRDGGLATSSERDAACDALDALLVEALRPGRRTRAKKQRAPADDVVILRPLSPDEDAPITFYLDLPEPEWIPMTQAGKLVLGDLIEAR